MHVSSHLAVWLQGQKPSDKYVSQAREATGSDTAANMSANAPTINKKGGGVGRADFAPSQQLQGLRGETQTPPDVRKGKYCLTSMLKITVVLLRFTLTRTIITTIMKITVIIIMTVAK